MTREEAVEVIKAFVAYGEHVQAFVYKGSTSIPIDALNMAIEALEQESIKFYYVESLDDYWVGRRLDNFYYATWHGRFGFIWSHSKYLPWGEHIVDENTLWKEHTYPSEPKEIPFTEWIVGFTKKYFQQEQNCVKCKHYCETEDATGVHSHCRLESKEQEEKMNEKKIAIEAEARGLDELTGQIEDLKDAMAEAPQVVIKNPRDCTITFTTINEAERSAQAAQSEPEPEETVTLPMDPTRKILKEIQNYCKAYEVCKNCRFEQICQDAGQSFEPDLWTL